MATPNDDDFKKFEDKKLPEAIMSSLKELINSEGVPPTGSYALTQIEKQEQNIMNKIVPKKIINVLRKAINEQEAPSKHSDAKKSIEESSKNKNKNIPSR